MGVPSVTQLIDNRFMTTWDEIPAEAWDNILLATPVMAALKLKGCWKTQVGGYYVDDAITYAVMTSVPFQPGDTLPAQKIENRTMAKFPLRNEVAGIQRTLVDDVANAG